MTKLIVAFQNYANVLKETFGLMPKQKYGKNLLVKVCGHPFLRNFTAYHEDTVNNLFSQTNSLF